MKTYDKYKPSGIDWIGDIPEHWKVKKLKFIGESIIGITYSPDDVSVDENDLLVLRSSNIQKGFLSFEDNVYVTKEVKEKHLTKAGDILLCARNGSAHLVGKSALIDEKSSGFTFGAFMTVFRSEFGRFLYYFFNSEIFKAQIGLFSTSTINQLTSDTLNNLLAAFPFEKDEQIAIAEYLDEKTAQIDKLIANKLRLIGLLREERTAIISQAVTRGINPNAKLKPSGIAWLGDIPKHWEAKKLKYLVEIYGRIGFRGYTNDDIVQAGQGAISLSPSNIKGNNLNLEQKTYVTWEKYHESPEIQIFENDVIFVKTGSTIGKIAIIPKCEECFTLNPQMVVFKKLKIYNKYLYYQFLNPVIRFQLDTQMTGGAAQTISQEKLNSLSIIEPPMEEQKQIVKFIETATNKIDATIEKIEREIGFMREYRTALISEVVTGKIKVV